MGNIPTGHGLRYHLSKSQLQTIVATIQDKFSIGIVEKRRKWFHQHATSIHNISTGATPSGSQPEVGERE